MRRSERVRRLPSRYSPPLEGVKPVKSSPPRKNQHVSRYMSKNVKTVVSAKPAVVSMPYAVPEHSASSTQISSQVHSALSKYEKPGQPTIAEIFGADPDKKGNGTSQADDVDVTGEGEPSMEPPSWIETGPMEAKGAPSSKPRISSTLAARFGIPHLGFADNLSESAAIGRCSFPADTNNVIEGARHPADKPPPKTLAPQKKKLIQQHLILLLHAYKCEKAVITKLPCPVPFCSVMKKVQAHMRQCTDGYSCSAPFCSSSRRIICHWKHCKTGDCVVCSRLKNLALRKKELEKMKAAGQVPLQAQAQVQVLIQGQAQALAVDHQNLPPQQPALPAALVNNAA